MLETYLACLDLGYFEVTEAFKNLPDELVWVRPADGLLSIGELAGHIAYWEAARFGGDTPDGGSSRDLSNCRIQSPLLAEQFGYYTSNIPQLPTVAHRSLTAAQVQAELLRVHAEAMAFLKERNPAMTDKAPYWYSNFGDLLKYMIFHVSYHTGQMYSVRHLLGDTTPDN